MINNSYYGQLRREIIRTIRLLGRFGNFFISLPYAAAEKIGYAISLITEDPVKVVASPNATVAEPYSEQTSLFNLPDEVIENILQFLSPKDLLKLAQTCRLLHKLVDGTLQKDSSMLQRTRAAALPKNIYFVDLHHQYQGHYVEFIKRSLTANL